MLRCSLRLLVTLITVCLLISSVAEAQESRRSRVNGLAILGKGDIGVVDPFTVVVVMKGSGKFETNALATDDSYKVSARSARVFAQTMAGHFGYDSNFSKYDISIEYDKKHYRYSGGSGAASEALGIIAALARLQARQDVAITGDVSQVGALGRVAGVEKKITAAIAGGMRTIIVPAANMNDVPQLPEEVLVRCQIVLASDMSQVLFHALGPQRNNEAFMFYWQKRTAAVELFKARKWKDCVNQIEAFTNYDRSDLSMHRLLVLATQYCQFQESAENLLQKAAVAERQDDLTAAADAYVLAVEDAQKAKLAIDDLRPVIEPLYQKAKKEYEKLATIDFHKARELHVLIEKLNTQFAFDETEAVTAMYSSLYGEYLQKHQMRIRELLDQGQVKEARDHLVAELHRMIDDPGLRSLQREINDAEAQALFVEAKLLIEQNDVKKAREKLRAALELTSDKTPIQETLDRLPTIHAEDDQ